MNVINFPSVSVQPLNETSLAAASELLRDCWHETYASHLPKDLLRQQDQQQFSEYLRKKQQRCWLAWYDDRLVGVMALSLNCIEELCVEPAYRRKKIGRRLIDAAMKDCIARNFQSLQVGIEAFNKNAIDFFESLGWREVGSEYVPLQTDHSVKALVYSRSCANL